METLNIASLVHQVSCLEHIIEPEVKYKYSTEKGDGYLGVIRAIELIGKNKSLEVIVKSAADNEHLRKQAPIREAFLTEMWFYEKIVPAQIAFQMEHQVQNPFVNYAKCYALSRGFKEEILLLENLKPHGYTLWNRKKPMNHEHLKLVFHEYGRFHGTNYAIKKLNPTLYKELTSKLVDMIVLFNRTEGFQQLLNQAMSKIPHFFDANKDKKYYDIIKTFSANPMEQLQATSELDDYSLILHGDCWCNNMMFNYKNPEDNTTPESVLLIDFQLCKEGSPVLDIAYFLYVCADKPALQRLDEYLKIYYQSLTDQLAKFGLDSNDVFPFAKLKEHWKRYGRFGYIMSVFLIKVMISDVDEVPDIANLSESNDFMKSFDYECRSEDEYKQRIRDLVYHLVDNGIL